MPIEAFDEFEGAGDPAALNRIAHDTAHALLHRVRDSGDSDVVERTVQYAQTHGLDDFVQLWSRASAHSLPGALWRLYLIHAAVTRDPVHASYLYRRGAEIDISIHRIVAGAVEPTGPDEVVALAAAILRGAFTGDFADALDRAAAFCAVMSQGAAALADSDEDNLARAAATLRRGARYLDFARDLAQCARLWRAGHLD